jgi:hypothetical protein
VIKDVALPEWKLNWVFWSWSIWDERRPLKPVKRVRHGLIYGLQRLLTLLIAALG